MNIRIDYIDRMKGFTIFLVVMGHVLGFSFRQPDDVAGRWISSFHIPLFMFLSGLVASSGIVAPYWSFGKLAKKLRGLLLPLFVFGLCYTFTFSKDILSGMVGFAESPAKNGYWYLMTLAMFYLSLCLYRLNVKDKWYVNVAMSFGIWGGYFVLWKNFAQTTDYFCILNCGNFYPFFMLGVFATKYGLLERLKNANWLFSVCIVAYALLFCVEMPVHCLLSLNKHIFLPFCMVAVVAYLFMARHGKTSRIEQILEAVGKRTLDVYVLHYFFVSKICLDGLGHELEATHNSLLLFVFVFLLSLVVTILSVGIGEILHKGRLLAKIVYGK